MTQPSENSQSSQPLGLPLNDQLGLAPERDAVLAQLDDTTNQTWAYKRRRWARLVRAQDAEIERLRVAVLEVIEFNRQHARDQYGDANKCETWACVLTLRAALRPNVKLTGEPLAASPAEPKA